MKSTIIVLYLGASIPIKEGMRKENYVVCTFARVGGKSVPTLPSALSADSF